MGISFNNKTIGTSSKRFSGGAGGYYPTGPTHANPTAKADFDFPQYVTSDAPASVLGTKTWTTRKCNDDIDVVHFSMAVVVEHQKVLTFMKELCSSKEHRFSGFSKEQQEKTLQHNQITILESSIEAVINSDPEHKRYRYGDNPVVKLNLVCEYIFRRAGYDKIKPKLIKEELGQLKITGRGNRNRSERIGNKRPGM